MEKPPKPPPEERMKSPEPHEKSKESSCKWQLIMEVDDEMFPCNIDPFSEELVYQFEVQDKTNSRGTKQGTSQGRI